MGALSFNEMEIDALGEMMNISLGASATAMSTLLGSTVHITTPRVKILTRDQFEFKKLEPAVGVEIAYVEGLEGSNIMMFSRNDVRIIVGTLLGEEVPDDKFELDEINRSAICEVMNQIFQTILRVSPESAINLNICKLKPRDFLVALINIHFRTLNIEGCIIRAKEL